MKWSLKLGSFAGIRVYVHWTFVLLLGWILFSHLGQGHDWAEAWRSVGFILALRLEPQQLRIGRQVARAADSDTPASEPELAYGTGDSIIVERYQGKLPRNLATSI